MKDTLKLLSEKQYESLAYLKGQESFKALKKLVELERVELAKDSLSQGHNIDEKYTAYLAGGSDKLKRLIKLIESIKES